MYHRFGRNETERLARELNISRQEAARFLHRAGGDYRKAVRLYIGEHNIFVEPERVEDAGRSAADEAAQFLRGAFLRMKANRGLRTAFMLALMLLALAAVPALVIPALISLFLRMRDMAGRYTAARTVL